MESRLPKQADSHRTARLKIQTMKTRKKAGVNMPGKNPEFPHEMAPEIPDATAHSRKNFLLMRQKIPERIFK